MIPTIGATVLFKIDGYPIRGTIVDKKHGLWIVEYWKGDDLEVCYEELTARDLEVQYEART